MIIAMSYARTTYKFFFLSSRGRGGERICTILGTCCYNSLTRAVTIVSLVILVDVDAGQ